MPSEKGEPADAPLVERLRAGDSDAFAEVVRAWSPMMLQAARAYVSTDASAQEVVQDAWLAMIRGLDKFEGLQLSEATDAFQREHIQRAIAKANGHMGEAARLLGLHRTNFYRKMKMLGMNV